MGPGEAIPRPSTSLADEALPPAVGGSLHGWTHPAVLVAAGLSAAAGFAQFAATAALPDVAEAFGAGTGPGTGTGGSVAVQVGLSATTLGLGTALIRLASLGALPLSQLADHVGRRRVILGCAATGLAFSVVSAVSPSFWVLVALLAAARAPLSATNALAGVIAAEETRSRDRAYAIALVTAGYGVGAGISALLRGAFGEALSFRELFLLAAVPLLAVPLLGRLLEEPARFARVASVAATGRVRLRGLEGALARRLAVTATLTFGVTFLTGPVTTNVFLYAERVLGMSRGTTAVAVLAAGPVGLVGLLVGRAAADRLGRVRSAAVAHVLLVAAGVWTYSGSPTAAVSGYLAGIAAGSAYAPAFGAISTELFPTQLRATASGVLTAAGVFGAVLGLIAFGVLADALGGYRTAALVIAAPVLALTALFALVPETRGLELEESAPDLESAPTPGAERPAAR